MKPGELRRWNVPTSGPTYFLVLEIKTSDEGARWWEGEVTFLTNGRVVTDDIAYIRSVSEKVLDEAG